MACEIFDSVRCSDFKIICLPKTWLSKTFVNQNLFPESYTVYL